MFKRDKHTVVSTRSLLKNRDVRRLRKDVCEQWKCHVDELNKIMPAKVCINALLPMCPRRGVV